MIFNQQVDLSLDLVDTTLNLKDGGVTQSSVELSVVHGVYDMSHAQNQGDYVLADGRNSMFMHPVEFDSFTVEGSSNMVIID